MTHGFEPFIIRVPLVGDRRANGIRRSGKLGHYEDELQVSDLDAFKLVLIRGFWFVEFLN
jgi:hypothetical protein